MIKDVLKKLYNKYNHYDFIKPDPLLFVYRYAESQDKEIVAFLSALLAYGRVEQIEKSLDDLFSQMGKSPYEFVKSFGENQCRKLSNFKHRFTTGQDISDLLEVLKKVLRENGSIEQHFLSGYNKGDENIIPALSRFCDSLYEIYRDYGRAYALTSAKQKGRQASRGLKYLLASPAGGSACKRLNLFLRWMVRSDEVDVGLWKGVDKAKLIVPVDVHMGRLCKILGLYDKKTVSLASAVDITKSFSEIEPSDPVKYDFALSRVGIIKGCNGKYNLGCKNCELEEFCK